LKTHQGITLETLRAIQIFLDKHASRLGNVGKSGSRRQLDQVVNDLTAQALAQGTNTRGASSVEKARQLRIDLIEKHMLPIARIAAVDLPRTPELAGLVVPRGTPTPEKLVAAANAMKAQATPYAQTFIDAGMPADFLAELEAAATAFAMYSAGRKTSIGVGKSATKGITAAISRGTRVITAIDGLVRKALDPHEPADQIIRTEWKSVKKVRKTATRSAVPAEPVPIPPAADSSAVPGLAPTGGGA
jgi:hypothetical protein